jgi:uncharacterized protein
MTPQEQDMIVGLIDRIDKTQLAEKDTDAEQMLQRGLGRNPDALYILAQTVLVQKYALDQAQTQLEQAKAQIEQMQQPPEPKHSTSFLGNLLGRHDDQPPPPPPPLTYPQQPGYPQYAPVSAYNAAPPQYGAPPPQYGAPQGMGGGGFLRGALQTATGVAAGALAFQGIESLMHGFGHEAGYGGGQGFGSFDGGQRPAEEIVNNYYGDDRGGRDVSADERSLGQQEDRDFGSHGSSDASSNDRDSLYDSDSSDEASLDTGTSDDDTSFDDGGDLGGDDGTDGGDDSSFS